jgi:hypothetical protein
VPAPEQPQPRQAMPTRRPRRSGGNAKGSLVPDRAGFLSASQLISAGEGEPNP